jgi:hypothetical protein
MVTSEHAPTAEEMDRLAEERRRAQAKPDHLDAEQRAANEALAVARGRLAEFERHGGGAGRRKLEQALAEADARVAEPWAVRRDGLRAAIRDRERELSQFAAAHLRELVGEAEARGEQAAQDMLTAAASSREAHARREGAATEIGQLVALAGGRVHPSDVGPPSNADAVAAEVERLLIRGEPGPMLRRYPGEPRGRLSAEPLSAA